MDKSNAAMTDAKLRLTIAIRERAYLEGDQQTVKECEAMIDEHYREGCAKAAKYMGAHRLRVPREYFLMIGQEN